MHLKYISRHCLSQFCLFIYLRVVDRVEMKISSHNLDQFSPEKADEYFISVRDLKLWNTM